MTFRPVFYVAHPVAPPCACPATSPLDQLQIACNVMRAKRWIRWLAERADVALCAPWIPYVETLPESPEWRARGLLDDEAMAARCDGIILVGGRVSSGMERETRAVIAARWISSGAYLDGDTDFLATLAVDLTALGSEPPTERGALPACLRPR